MEHAWRTFRRASPCWHCVSWKKMLLSFADGCLASDVRTSSKRAIRSVLLACEAVKHSLPTGTLSARCKVSIVSVDAAGLSFVSLQSKKKTMWHSFQIIANRILPHIAADQRQRQCNSERTNTSPGKARSHNRWHNCWRACADVLLNCRFISRRFRHFLAAHVRRVKRAKFKWFCKVFGASKVVQSRHMFIVLMLCFDVYFVLYIMCQFIVACSMCVQLHRNTQRFFWGYCI